MSQGNLGEFEIIDRLRKKFHQNSSVIVPSGDDAAVVAMPDGDVVITTDVAVEGVHFRKEWSTPIEIGQRITAQNFSDVVAMGAWPVAIVVAVVAPKETPLNFLEALTAGIEDECKKVDASVVGGDMSRGDQLMIAITAIGQRRGVKPVLRSGAQVGDTVYVSGRLGYSAAGLACLMRGSRSPREAVSAYLTVEPNYQLGIDAARSGATSMIDISDGLVADAGHVATSSKVRINLDSSALAPGDFLTSLAQGMGVDPWQWVLAGGEDHGLLATFSGPAPEGFRPIGRVEAGEEGVLVDGQTPRFVHGHDHFAG
ncbi:MAG: thiamine monophosphate kinase [Actinomycetota bacterium]|jgi:thiamine-monophosphate kinase